MAAKQVILFIVEGMSDMRSLELILTRYFSNSHVKVEVTHGDIISDINTNASNISAKIGKIVKACIAQNRFKQKDFLKVVHLIDMDGAYIDDGCIVQDDRYEKPFYTTRNIFVKNIEKIVDRNERKRNNINKISSMPKVLKDIPYEAYYMSSNLDHALHNRINISDEEKEKCAYEFEDRFANDLPGFIEFMNNPSYCINTTMKESWQFIKVDRHSLERYTNFGLCFRNKNTN